MRGLLADADLAAALRAALCSRDDYAGNGKPQIDRDERAAREELIDSRARDGYELLDVLDRRALAGAVEQAATLLATVLWARIWSRPGQGVPDCAAGHATG